MPNSLVPAALGLPVFRPYLANIMRQAHAEARAIGPRLPYAARLSLTLRRAWREARAAMLRSLRAAVEARVERLLAFLDHLDGDVDLEPSLAGASFGLEVDAEHDDAEAGIGDLDGLWEQGSPPTNTIWEQLNVAEARL